ncbi:WD40/YVTN repeat-like-containing domain [Penicillium roqueforti FM164]|uniref:WD40/YVTN repeat-like-containing domain n=1 Tax=Penicillium roqueforti (strain FM164) TaxID=1365484 RepID=W6PTD7_PENRF|nr:WD40/YVTN repeat-like-containing domain [Penicillium roqueforti FM164]
MSDVAPQTSFDTISCVKVEKNTIIAGTQDWYHLCAVLCLKLHGNYLVSGGHDGVARVWKIETGQCKDVLRSHERMRMQLSLLAHIGPTAQNQRSGGGCETLKNLQVF